MKTRSYSQFRASLATLLDEVNADREPLLITRQGQQSAVLMSADDYASIEATLHLLRQPANAERLRESIAELKSDGGSERDLMEEA